MTQPTQGGFWVPERMISIMKIRHRKPGRPIMKLKTTPDVVALWSFTFAIAVCLVISSFALFAAERAENRLPSVAQVTAMCNTHPGVPLLNDSNGDLFGCPNNVPATTN